MPKRPPKLKLVPESEATGRTREIYREIKDALGVPLVNVIFQAYGAHPKFLELFWSGAQPALRRQQFFSLAERVRADAYTRVHSYLAVPDFCLRVAELRFSNGARQELTETVELFQYNNPPLLLLAAAALQAFGQPVGRDAAEDSPASHPVFHLRPILIEEPAAPPPVRQIYEEIGRTLGLPVVNTDYRAFARWPDFLAHYWGVLRPIIESPLYAESQFGVRDTAMALARELPAVLDLRVARLERAGLGDEALRDLMAMTETFVRGLSGLVLNIAIAKVGLEGGTAQGRRETHREEKVA